MQEIVVARPFVLTGDDGQRQSFGVGLQKVEAWVANHWYTKLHLQPENIAPTDPGLLQAGNATALSADVGVLTEALATEREITNKLKLEVGRLTGEISALFDRANIAENKLAEHLKAVNGAAPTETAPEQNANTTITVPAPVPATATAPAEQPPFMAPTPTETPEETEEPDEPIGNYIVRKKGRFFNVLRTDGNGVVLEIVAEGLPREEAEAKANELKGVN